MTELKNLKKLVKQLKKMTDDLDDICSRLDDELEEPVPDVEDLEEISTDLSCTHDDLEDKLEELSDELEKLEEEGEDEENSVEEDIEEEDEDRIAGEEIIKKMLKHWKDLPPKGEHYDKTEESHWIKDWRKREYKCQSICNDLIKSKSFEKDISLLQELFSMKKECPLFNQRTPRGVGKLIEVLRKSGQKKNSKIKRIVYEIKGSKEFREDWVKRFYSLLEIDCKRIKTNLRKVISELYLRLHPDNGVMFNACSCTVLSTLYEFDKKDYNDFKNAFEYFKNHDYKKIVGKLSPKKMCLNAEIDMCFNYFHKDATGKELLQNLVESE